MKFEELEGFKKDVNLLSKKYTSLKEDMLVVKKILTVMPDERPPFSVRLENDAAADIIKLRKIACKSLKGCGVNSGLQLLYVYRRQEERITLMGLFHRDKPSLEQKIARRKTG